MSPSSKPSAKHPRKKTSEQQSAVLGLLVTSELFQHRLGKFLRQHKLTQSQYDLLRVLKDADAPMRSLEIAEKMITVVPAITSSINTLERKGFVVRERSQDDKRVCFVLLTTSGRKFLTSIAKPIQNLHEELLDRLTPQECKQLTTLLKKARIQGEN